MDVSQDQFEVDENAFLKVVLDDMGKAVTPEAALRALSGAMKALRARTFLDAAMVIGTMKEGKLHKVDALRIAGAMFFPEKEGRKYGDMLKFIELDKKLKEEMEKQRGDGK